MQIAMTALILLTGISSCSCDVVFFPIHFFFPAIVQLHSASLLCLFEPAIRPLAVDVNSTVRSTDCV